MKHAWRFLCLSILTVGLMVYGVQSHAGMAMGGGDGFAMVICADGKTETIIVNADGAPVDPAQRCCDCTACTDLGATAPLPERAVSRVIFTPVPGAALTARPHVSHYTQSARPMPRAPPVPASWSIAQTAPVSFAKVILGQSAWFGGCPSKDTLS